MTDEHDQQLTPAQETEVRRLLAGARHTEPMPADVADRMDRVLAGLADHPSDTSATAPVTRLAERRRRVVTLLVAAAAVVVVGIGLGQVISTSGGPDAMQSEDTAAGAAEQEPGAAADERDSRVTADASEPVTLVRPGRFTDDVRRLRGAVTPTEAEGAPAPQVDARGRRLGKAGCEPGDWGPGVYRPVKYGRSTGYVVFRPAHGDTQVADLFLCGSDDVVRTVTLPSP